MVTYGRWRSRRARSTSRDICRSTQQRALVDVVPRAHRRRGARATSRSCAAAARCTCGCCASAVTGTARRYSYEATRSDYDDLAVPPLPEPLRDLAREIAAAAGMALEPDLCILNYYDRDGRMGLHQDKDESAESLAAGLPVVSVSLGDTARVSCSADCGGAIRSRRCCSSPATGLCSAARRGCAITACPASCRVSAPPELGLDGPIQSDLPAVLTTESCSNGSPSNRRSACRRLSRRFRPRAPARRGICSSPKAAWSWRACSKTVTGPFDRCSSANAAMTGSRAGADGGGGPHSRLRL